MSPKKLIIIITLLGLVIIILGAVLMFFLTPEGGGPSGTPPPGPTDVTPPDITATGVTEFNTTFLTPQEGTVAPSAEEKARFELTLLAQNFIQDYGSYSTVGGYDHIRGWYKAMTTKMQEDTETWLLSDPAKGHSPSFYSIETRAGNVRIEQMSSSEAKVVLDAQRIETDVPEHYQKTSKHDVVVSFVKMGGEWKVDKLEWE